MMDLKEKILALFQVNFIFKNVHRDLKKQKRNQFCPPGGDPPLTPQTLPIPTRCLPLTRPQKGARSIRTAPQGAWCRHIWGRGYPLPPNPPPLPSKKIHSDLRPITVYSFLLPALGDFEGQRLNLRKVLNFSPKKLP